MVHDMHGPHPTAAMGDAMMAVKAQIIEEETQQKCAEGDWDALHLKRRNSRQNAERDKGRKAINRIAQQARCDAHQRIFGRHLSARAP